jgi:hypothetical protein
MLRLRIAAIYFVLTCALFAQACSGNSATPVSEETGLDPAGFAPGIPMDPVEPRNADAVTGAFKLGNEFSWRHNAPDVGTDLHLIAPEPPGDSTAWAYYEFADTGMQPLALTVNAQYYDPNPHEDLPDEGYWIAYADYAKGSWVYSGPHRQGQARVFIPPEADLVSPGGFLYALALTWGGTEALIHSLQIGYDDGFDYEESWLSVPQGAAVGNRCDIQLDPAGQPQIAYLRADAMAFSESGKARVAARSPTGWEIADVDSSISVSLVRLAIGDGGRRALLLLEDEYSNVELWLCYDNGTGDFSDQHQLSALTEEVCLPGITFVNSADNPLGDRDLAVMTYAIEAGGSDQTTVYRIYDGVVLSPELLLYPVNTTRGATLSLSTRADKSAMVGVADKLANWEYDVGFFSAVAPPPAWDFVTVTSWVGGSDIDSYDEFAPDFALRELPSGDYVAAYRSNGEVTLARWDGIGWQENEHDRHPLADTELMDMEAYSDDYVGVPGSYGPSIPVLHRGKVGVATMTWDTHYLDGVTAATRSSSLAVGTDDTSHLAVHNMDSFTLDYITRTAGGDVAIEEVDNGGMLQGRAIGQAEVMAVDDQLHVFYVDAGHMWPMHAVNVGGIWVKDAEPISRDTVAYFFTGQGYLESNGMLYCSWWDVNSGSLVVATADGDLSEWQLTPFCPVIFSPYSSVADDGENIGALTIQLTLMSEGYIAFCQGPPRESVTAFETVGAGEGAMSQDWHLAFNPSDGTWGALTTDDNSKRIRYYYREAENEWLGPSTVLQRGGNGRATALGLSYRESDGAARALVLHKPDASTVNYLSVYTAPQGSMDFLFVSTFASVDTVLENLGPTAGVVDAAGEPVAFLGHKLLADSMFDVDIYTLSGVDTWASTDTWNDAFVASIFLGATVTPDGFPVVAACEFGVPSPHQDSIGVYYPW